MADALFIASQLALIAFGFPAFFHPPLRRLPWVARLGAAFMLGALMLSLWAIILAITGLQWRVWLLALGPLVTSFGISVWMMRNCSRSLTTSLANHAPRIAAILLIALGLAHFGVRIMTGRSSSVDFLLFWGVKAHRFAALGGFDEELARWGFAIHTHPNYPPLYPLTLVWGKMTVGELPWLGAFLMSVIWFSVTLPLLYGLLRLRIRAPRALGVTTFWAVAMSASLGRSFSAGNAEAMLIAYATIAIAALLIESREDEPSLRWIAALAMAGAMVTKVEGLILWGLIVVATIVRELFWRRAAVLRRVLPLIVVPALTYGLWAAYLLANHITLGDPTRNPGRIHLIYLGSVLGQMFEYLDMGSFALAWLLPPGLLLWTRGHHARSEWIAALPAVGTAFGLLLAFFLYYITRPYDPTLEIAWTLPRLAQPALSAWILALGLISAGREEVGVPSR